MGNPRFGTDGWRGVIAEDFTVRNLRLVVQAIMSHISGGGRLRKVVVGYDTRFMSEYCARAAAEVAAGNGAKVLISPRPVTTPMLSYAVTAEDASGGIMVTASHNPYNYNGIKFKASYGGSATPEIACEIESRISKSPVLYMPYDKARDQGAVAETDFFIKYMERIRGLLDATVLRESRLRAVLDCMHGSVGYHAVALWESLGLELKVLRQQRDPYFGGVAPEPLEKNMAGLTAEVRESGSDMGFVTDGDADRLGVVDGGGAYVNPHQVFALLLLHMRRNRKKEGMVVKTVSTSSLIDRIAKDLGLPVRETPVGFKHICGLMLAEEVMIGGEENGGLGISGYIPERDGVLTALLLIEMAAVEAKGVRELLAEVEKKYGRFYYKRHDERLEGTKKTTLLRDVEEKAKSVFDGFGVKEVKTFDGVKVCFGDGSWVLFRQSGTEPLVRVYCEAGDPVRVEKIIDRGREAFLG